MKRLTLILAVLAAGALGACSQTTKASPLQTTVTTQQTPTMVQHKTKPHKNKPHKPPVYRAPQGLFVLPNSSLTPGTTDPRVTQANIHQTICVSGYTATVRPPESITAPEKRASMAAYGDTGPPSAYEYDHLISLEIGGAPNDLRNLWPEPGRYNPKDGLENYLHRQVCSGAISLATAQHEIATNWVAAYHAWRGTAPTPTPTPTPAPTPAPTPTPSAPTTHSNWHAGEFCSVSKEAQYEQAGFHCVSSGSRHRLQ
jgi:hypothetical protein